MNIHTHQVIYLHCDYQFIKYV